MLRNSTGQSVGGLESRRKHHTERSIPRDAGGPRTAVGWDIAINCNRPVARVLESQGPTAELQPAFNFGGAAHVVCVLDGFWVRCCRATWNTQPSASQYCEDS